MTRNDNIKAGLKLKLDSRRRQQAEAADNLQKADRERSAAAQRIHILEDLERDMDGYQQSVKAVMRAAGGGRLRGIIGPVAGIITVEKGYGPPLRQRSALRCRTSSRGPGLCPRRYRLFEGRARMAAPRFCRWTPCRAPASRAA